ncbi:MAG: sigma-54 dependent transcriptional regulator [Haliea sp.]|uniref:sigma-54-dependent transcriptional regulator n=1 Tax=Haliea sp. TaxID=1932666 RepID=UPI0032EC8D87
MGAALKVLVVEDDSTLRDALCDTIEYGGYRVWSACDGADALQQLERQPVDLIISDVQMSGMGGERLLREVRARSPELPFVMITAHGSVQHAVSAMREGATDYLLKPFAAEVLLEMLARFEPAPEPGIDMVAEDPAMQRVCRLAERLAHSDATVLVTGESGTGKEVIARYLHACSSRAERPMVAINCAAIPENMLESMLFGYEKGAYTGAHQSRPGKFEQANGGTLLLDEISEMDLGLQAKLLRVLQEKEVERLGGNRVIPLDVRVIATSNRNLAGEVAAGRFREDLYYRLSVVPLEVPALRARPADILPLAQRFLQRHAPPRSGLAFSKAALQRLTTHNWRGNVRELENCVQRASLLAVGPEIGPEDIDFVAAMAPAAPVAAVAPVVAAEAPPEPLLEGDLKERERELIVAALSAVDGNRKEAAQRLGISPRTLRYKLARFRELGLAVPRAQ